MSFSWPFRLRGPAIFLLAATLAGCARNPVTGRTQLALISEGQEIQMGRDASRQVEQSLGLVPDSALQAYVQRVGERLAAASERPQLPWTFRVVDDATPNAFALPGGFIYLTRGMMSLMDSEAELASVLGHEIGHVTARHSVTAISRAQIAQLGLGLGSIVRPELQQFGQLAEGALGLLFLQHGRDAERQADDLGYRYALQGGYDVREMPDVFATLQRVGDAEQRGSVPSWLATHPFPAERIARVQERLAADTAQFGATRVARDEYLRRIDGLTYGVNPRSGIFRGTAFLHPDLRFRMDFPQGWRTQNTPQAVMAAAPQGDAAVQLTLSEFAPDEAARRFLAQQGVQPVQSGRETINGNPAVASLFRAQAQGGIVGGIATWVAYGGRTYQILAYSPEGRFGAYERAFRATAGSFRALDDPAVLALQPNRLALVRLQRGMTLAEFGRQFPSVIPIEELALINQVQGAESPLAAGALVKRVVAGAAR
jgi:predicted Zn-dependent protease